MPNQTLPAVVPGFPWLLRQVARSTQLLLLGLFVDALDLVPVEPGFLSDVLARHDPAARSHEEGETLSAEWMIIRLILRVG